jgi:hypothetical protein
MLRSKSCQLGEEFQQSPDSSPKRQTMNWNHAIDAFPLFVILLLCAFAPAQATGKGGIDYADSKQVGSWLHHPVIGDPSFDSFERLPGNPVYRGNGEFGWPVNGFLFIDPVSKNWYVYVGEYMTGYVPKSRCVLLRSTNEGKSWENLGPIVKGDPKMFDKDGHTPDATVVYEKGRYHMVYDWGELNFNAEGGLAYAWADKPEGPWHRSPEPITRNTLLSKIDGRYVRTYGGTLIHRKNDWLILGLMDNAPTSWTLFAMTAKKPEGPYSERIIVRQVERDYFHPPLIEFFPVFTHDGYIYAQGTSVALNRDYQLMYKVAIEKATDPKAWKIERDGSNWHSDNVENEYEGIWGQTYSGAVLPDGRIIAMFNSRDPQNRGTVNLAQRQWNKPLRSKGFRMSGHGGPSFSLIDRSYKAFTLNAKLKVTGTARIVFDYQGPIGPDKPTSDATLHPLMMTRCSYIELSESGMKLFTVDAKGQKQSRSEASTSQIDWTITVKRSADDTISLSINDKLILEERMAISDGPIGLWVGPRSFIDVTQFEIEGPSEPAHQHYLYTEGLLGVGESPDSWEVRQDPIFRFGEGASSRKKDHVVKWNFFGTGVKLWSPKGPEWGRVKLFIDGKECTVLNLYSDQLKASAVIFEKKGLRKGHHFLTLRDAEGKIVVDSLEVISSAKN